MFFTRLAAQHHERTQGSNCKPCRAKPPEGFRRTDKTDAGVLLRSPGRGDRERFRPANISPVTMAKTSSRIGKRVGNRCLSLGGRTASKEPAAATPFCSSSIAAPVAVLRDHVLSPSPNNVSIQEVFASDPAHRNGINPNFTVDVDVGIRSSARWQALLRQRCNARH